MEFITQIGIGGYSVLGYIIPFLMVLTVVVFFHELGHYAVARWNDVDVEAFSVGFGPEIVGFNDRNGTRWKLCIVPLGGYVKFLGDANGASMPDHEKLQDLTEEQKAGSFEHKRVGQRAAVVAAGPIANFILAVVIFAGSFYFIGRFVADPVVSVVVEDSAAEAAGFLRGDIVLTADGQEVKEFSQLPRFIGPNHGREMKFVVLRDGKEIELLATPRLTEQTDQFGNVNKTGLLGIRGDPEDTNVRHKEFGAVEALTEGVGEVSFIVKRTFQFLGAIIVGRESADQLSGPIGIAKVANDFWQLGWYQLIYLTGLLSVSIGLLNLFPVPVLDGGHLVFYAFEAIRGRALDERTQEISFRIGFVLILCLMVFATRNDILNRLPSL